MGFDLVRAAQGASLSRREERAVSRELARLESGAATAVARTRAHEAVECAKVEAIGTVAAIALAETAGLSAQEAAHVARNPHVAGRLAYVADEASIAVGRRLVSFGRRLDS